MSVDDVFAQVLEAMRQHEVEGITFSGGEPFQQAEALAHLAARCNEQGLNAAAFTGYAHEFLCSVHAPAGAHALLAQIDLLIDGPYTAALRREDLPLRGSSNQRLVPLTPAGRKLADRVTDDLPMVEFNFTSGKLAVTGFPR
jgi:anaerobic ribonucleoside-triphosphate reductase activating protein